MKNSNAWGRRDGSLAVLVILVATAALAGVAAAPMELVAQPECFECEKGMCKDKGGGAGSCSVENDGDHTMCATSGGCQCVKVRRRFRPDTQICTPVATADGVRRVELNGSMIAVHRVGPDHYAASACGSDEWVVLARELPNGELGVTTMPVLIRLRRWAFGLGAPTAADDA